MMRPHRLLSDPAKHQELDFCDSRDGYSLTLHNDKDHRPRARGAEYETGAQSRGSVDPLVRLSATNRSRSERGPGLESWLSMTASQTSPGYAKEGNEENKEQSALFVLFVSFPENTKTHPDYQALRIFMPGGERSS